MDQNYWLIYRVRDHTEGEMNASIYGWTDKKSVLKSFMEQRDERKYRPFRMEFDEIIHKFNDGDLPDEKRLDCIKLKSVQTGESISLFMTLLEVGESVKKILRLFVELSSLCNIKSKDPDKDILYFVMLIINLKPKYADALEYLGYRPPEIDSFIDSVYGTHEDEVNEMVDQSIAEAIHPLRRRDPGEIPGASALEDVSDKIIYSLEAFIKVMREDL